MKRIRMLLAGFCAVLLLGVGTGGLAFADSAPEPAKTTVMTVNINQADAQELAAVLVNIGASKAEAIVKYREDHGLFTNKAQLLNIKGIGKATLEKNNALITL